MPSEMLTTMPPLSVSPHEPPSRPSPAPETQRLYAGDWAAFAVWCRAAGLRASPAEPETVAAYLDSLAPSYGYGALARRLAAIADRHRQGSVPPPAIDPRTTALLRARRSRRQRSRPLPPSPDQLVRMATACSGDRTGQRDRALLLLLAMGLSRTVLVGLDAEDVQLTTTGMELTLRAAGPDDGAARIVAIARVSVLAACPVRALEDWMRASDTRFGPVFRKVDRWGNVEHSRLGADAIRRVLARWGRHAHKIATRRTPRGAAGEHAAGGRSSVSGLKTP